MTASDVPAVPTTACDNCGRDILPGEWRLVLGEVPGGNTGTMCEDCAQFAMTVSDMGFNDASGAG